MPSLDTAAKIGLNEVAKLIYSSTGAVVLSVSDGGGSAEFIITHFGFGVLQGI